MANRRDAWICLLAVGICSCLAVDFPDNKGKKFVVLFQDNDPSTEPVELFLTTTEKVVEAKVSAPLLAERGSRPHVEPKTVKVTRGEITSVTLNNRLRLKGTKKENKGILIEATGEVIVYGANRGSFSTDAFLCLPVDILGTQYYAPSWPKKDRYIGPQIGVVAVEDGTRVTFTFPNDNRNISVSYDGRTYVDGSTLQVSLDKYETFHVQNEADLTGTKIISTKPIAVTSGNKRTKVGFLTSSDHLVEMIPPVSTWGKKFVTVPIAKRKVGDIFRIIASKQNTVISVRGTVNTTVHNYTVDQGQYLDLDVASDEFLYIHSSNAILINQLCKTAYSDNTDPFMMYLPPVEQFSGAYTFATVKSSYISYKNFVNIVIKTTEIKGLVLDGSPIKKDAFVGNWTVIAGTEYSGNTIAVSRGTHSLYHESPIVSFAAFLYGMTNQESYGYPAGTRLASIGDSCIKSKSPDYADGKDNDCDGRIDEEIPNGVDDDGDGIIDEDLAYGSGEKWVPGNNDNTDFDIKFAARKQEEERKTVTIALGTSIPAVALIALGILLYLLYRKKRGNNQQQALVPESGGPPGNPPAAEAW
ncbi:IgGFc-binding protein [Lingula anatina]|uniref:IgGFc-binding protein n=1 Tax=Lingula anatina TaxID=7574 RepID=A0A1S3JCS4_LINAN|nr:IgGFc-binding protein [Lingula anatina]|eukprot:XP_013407689.1 IgGFc-binding protein [Lingula anatina]